MLEYIHSKGYAHNDVKAQNMLLGHGRGGRDVFLVDFGLVSKYERNGVHLEYKPDPRKMHDGTIEYLSRDAHIGVKVRRNPRSFTVKACSIQSVTHLIELFPALRGAGATSKCSPTTSFTG